MDGRKVKLQMYQPIAKLQEVKLCEQRGRSGTLALHDSTKHVWHLLGVWQ